MPNHKAPFVFIDIKGDNVSKELLDNIRAAVASELAGYSGSITMDSRVATIASQDITMRAAKNNLREANFTVVVK